MSYDILSRFFDNFLQDLVKFFSKKHNICHFARIFRQIFILYKILPKIEVFFFPLDYIDKILEDYKPKNVVTILCDGMGSNILDRMLDKDSFLIKNRLKTITSVFPATTVAATLSMLTGLNPCETGMLGWDMYYKDIDKTITVFINSEKGDPDFKPLQDPVSFIVILRQFWLLLIFVLLFGII